MSGLISFPFYNWKVKKLLLTVSMVYGIQFHSTIRSKQMTVYHIWIKMRLSKKKNILFHAAWCCKSCASLLEPLTCCVGLNGVEPVMALVPWKIPDEILPPGKGANSPPLRHHLKLTLVWNSKEIHSKFSLWLLAPTQTKWCTRNATDNDTRLAARDY